MLIIPIAMTANITQSVIVYVPNDHTELYSKYFLWVRVWGNHTIYRVDEGGSKQILKPVRSEHKPATFAIVKLYDSNGMLVDEEVTVDGWASFTVTKGNYKVVIEDAKGVNRMSSNITVNSNLLANFYDDDIHLTDVRFYVTYHSIHDSGRIDVADSHRTEIKMYSLINDRYHADLSNLATFSPHGCYIRDLYIPSNTEFLVSVAHPDFIPVVEIIKADVTFDSQTGVYYVGNNVYPFVPVTYRVQLVQKPKEYYAKFSGYYPTLYGFKFKNVKFPDPVGQCVGMSAVSVLYYTWLKGKTYVIDDRKHYAPVQGNFNYTIEHVPPKELFSYEKDIQTGAKKFKRYATVDGIKILPIDNVILQIALHQKHSGGWLLIKYTLRSYKEGSEKKISLDEALKMIENDFPVMIASRDERHARVAFGYVKDLVNGTILFAVYDSNVPYGFEWMKYNPAEDTILLPKTLTFWDLSENIYDYERHNITKLSENYTMIVSTNQIKIIDKETGKTGYFDENNRFVSTIPYSAGFMEYTKTTDGRVDTLYVVSYPRSCNIEIKTENTANDLDPITVLTFKNAIIEELTVVTEKPVYLEVLNNSTILIKSNGNTWINVTPRTLNTTAENLVASVFNIQIPKNATVYINTAKPNEAKIDLNGDGTIDLIPKAPVASFGVSKTNVTVGETITFNATLSYDPDGTIVSYEWDFEDNTTEGVIVNHTYYKAGEYIVTLTVTDNDGNEAKRSVVIRVSSRKPVASFTYAPQNATTEDTIRFIDRSYDPDGNITAWHWDFGDGTTSNAQNPTHRYAKAGNYTVTLTVVDNDGKTNSTSKQIVVRTIEEENKPFEISGFVGITAPVALLLALMVSRRIR